MSLNNAFIIIFPRRIDKDAIIIDDEYQSCTFL